MKKHPFLYQGFGSPFYLNWHGWKLLCLPWKFSFFLLLFNNYWQILQVILFVTKFWDDHTFVGIYRNLMGSKILFRGELFIFFNGCIYWKALTVNFGNWKTIFMIYLQGAIPTYLKEKVNVIWQVLFVSLFALLFINLYVKGTIHWFNRKSFIFIIC